MLDARYSISNRKGGREKFKYINGAIGFDPSTMLRAGRLTIKFRTLRSNPNNIKDL
jgi:hypothetical protein